MLFSFYATLLSQPWSYEACHVPLPPHTDCLQISAGGKQESSAAKRKESPIQKCTTPTKSPTTPPVTPEMHPESEPEPEPPLASLQQYEEPDALPVTTEPAEDDEKAVPEESEEEVATSPKDTISTPEQTFEKEIEECVADDGPDCGKLIIVYPKECAFLTTDL